MDRPYPAVLGGDQLEWNARPPNVSEANGVKVEVLEPQAETDALERRFRAVAALRELAAMGGIQSIPDPVAWQREMRKDRPLPGREL